MEGFNWKKADEIYAAHLDPNVKVAYLVDILYPPLAKQARIGPMYIPYVP